MPLLDPYESLEGLTDAVPGRRERIEAESDPEPGSDIVGVLDRLLEQVENEARGIYPGEAPSMDDQARLQHLSARARRLRPARSLQFGEVGSPGQQGNPFSIDTRGAARGVGNLGLGILNRLRANRVDEFAPEMSRLQADAEAFEETRENRRKHVAERLPELEGREDEQAHDIDLEGVRHEGRVAEEDNRQVGRVELENLRQDFDREMESLEGGDGTNSISPSVITSGIRAAEGFANEYQKKAERLHDLKNDNPFADLGPDIDKNIKKFERAAADLNLGVIDLIEASSVEKRNEALGKLRETIKRVEGINAGEEDGSQILKNFLDRSGRFGLDGDTGGPLPGLGGGLQPGRYNDIE